MLNLPEKLRYKPGEFVAGFFRSLFVYVFALGIAVAAILGGIGWLIYKLAGWWKC